MKANSWVIFAAMGVALLTLGIVISSIVGQERIPGSSNEYRRTSPFAAQGLVLGTIGGLMIIATITGNIGYRLARDTITDVVARAIR